MLKRNAIYAIIVAAIIIVSGASYYFFVYVPQNSGPSTVNIGVLTSLTGGESPYGLKILHGAEFAAQTINSQGVV